TEIYLKSGLIPALGYKTLQVKAVTTEMDQLISISKQTIENEKIIVQFENGKINLLNKEQQSIINDLIRFENVADAGDSVDFSPLERDQAIYIETSEL
ncbi:alpha-mannosidase, partial [Escherichia coli]|nr:alpha-mannosidase [Escherichia coli]